MGSERPKQLYPPDTRFYEGYVWVSTDEACKYGLCMPGVSARVAVDRYFARTRAMYWNRGKVFTVWTLDRPDGVPVRHDVVM